MGFYVLHPFTGSDGAAWDPTVFSTVRNARRTDGVLPTVQTNRGQMAMDAGDFRHVASPAVTLADFDLKVKLRFVAPSSPPNMYPEIGYRFNTNIDSGQPMHGYLMQIVPHAMGIRAISVDDAALYNVITNRNDVFLADTLDRYFRIRVKGDQHQFKWWLTTDPEPPTFGMSFTDATYPTGRIMLSCWNNDAAEACTVEWDDLRIEEIDPVGPGVQVGPTGLSAIYGGDRSVVAAYVGAQSIPVPT